MSKEETKTELVLSSDFKPFQLQIDKFKDVNKNTVFDYDDPKGNKEARSHVFKLRTTKKPINDAHEKAKADILKKGRELDSYKNNLISQIDDMIDVHAEPLKVAAEKQEKAEAFAKEAKRLKEESEALIIKIGVCHESAILLNDVFDQKAEMDKIKKLQQDKQDELDKQAKEQKEKQEKIDNEERIKKEENEKAEKEAETKRIEAETKLKDAEIKRISDIQEIKDKAKKDKEDAEQKRIDEIAKVEKENQDSIDKLKSDQDEKDRLEKKRIDDEKADAETKRLAEVAKAERLQKIEDARQADVKHRKKVNNNIMKCLSKFKVGKDDAKDLITAIVKNEIPGLTVNY